MPIDRDALASDLEKLGLKAIAGQTASGKLPVNRALKSVERFAERAAARSNAAQVDAAHVVLNRYRPEGT